MDGVLVDFESGIEKFNKSVIAQYKDHLDDIPEIFSKMSPKKDALASYAVLSQHYDTYILSTAPWENPSAWKDKLEWVKKYLGEMARKRLILTHHKDLNRGDFLVDDSKKNGADKFHGKHIHFGSERFPDWETVTEYLLGLCR